MIPTDSETELVVFFVGNCVYFTCGSQVEEMRKVLDGALKRVMEGGATRIEIRDTVMLISPYNFLGWRFQPAGTNYQDRFLRSYDKLLKTIDPDSQAPWRGGED